MTEQLNNLAQAWWTWSVSIFWQVGLLILLVACVDRLIRKWTWPQVRYALWLMILVKLILPPGWHLPSSLTGHVQPLAKRFISSSPVNPVNTEPVGLPSVYNPMTADSTKESFNAFTVNHEATIDRALIPEPLSAATPIFSRQVDVLPGTAVDWRVYAMSVWLLGAGVLSLWLVNRLRRLRKGLPEHRVLLPASFYMQVEKCAHSLDLRRVPRVIVTNKVIVPAVMGTLRPVLLMPQGFLSRLSRKDTEHMLLHEFAHIKRGDLYVHGIYLFLQIAFWYNPLLWLVRRQLHHLRELCCDATVARLLRDKAGEYRQTLLDVARRYLARSTEPSLGLLGLFEDANRLAVRLTWLTKPTWRYARTRTLLILVLIAVMTACVLPMAQADNSSDAALVQETAVAEATTDIDATTDVEATTTPATESLSTEERAQLQRQIQQLARQQLQLQIQLQQLNQALRQNGASADQAPPSLVPSEQPLTKPAKVKRLDVVKDKAIELKNDLADSEYWQEWSENLQDYVNEVEQKVNSPEFQARIKQYADKFDQEVSQRIKAWSDSNEVKQWRQDLKVWEENMQRWSEDMADAVKQKWMPERHNGSDNVIPESPHISSPPPMPKMPPMPPMPKLRPLEPMPEVHIPDIHIPVEIETHEHGSDANRVEYQRSLHMNPAYTGTTLSVQNNVGRISVQGSRNNDCGIRANIRVKAETPEVAEELAKQVKLIWDENDARAVLKPVLPDLPVGAHVSVDMTLTIPQQWDVTLTTEVGDLTVKGMQGTVQAKTNVGAVSAEATGKDMALESNVGDVSLSVAKDASATINAFTDIGSIESDFDFTSSKNTSVVHIPMALGSVKRLTLGSGEASVHLKSNVGSIRVSTPDFVKPKAL